jgi:Domain of unknown function (DUF4157)
MTRQTSTQKQPQTPTISSLSRGNMLQRKCVSCGQHTIAGGECAGCAKTKVNLQRKLTIGASNDPLELEADRVADRVMSASPSSVVNSAPPRIQRFTGQTAGQADLVAPASVDSVLSSPGSPLDAGLQQDMGQRFWHDFSRVRVHTDAAAARSARDVNANAYTVGQDIVFGAGRFDPGTQSGRRLIAHELTHVVQQSAVLGTSLPSHAEQDANLMAQGSPSRRDRTPLVRSALILARKVNLAKGETVVSMRVVKNAPGSKSPSTVNVTTSMERTFSYVSSQDNIPVGSHTAKKVGTGLQINVDGSGYVLYFLSNSNSPPPGSLVFTAEFPVEVVDSKSSLPVAGSEKGSGGGNGEGSGLESKGLKPVDSSGDKIGGGKKEADKSGGNKDGSKDGIKGGLKDGVKGGSKDGGNVPIPEAVTELPKDFKGLVVQVSDPADVEKLKKMGLIPAKTADEIKSKLDKGEVLSLDEVMALVEGLNAVTEPPAKETGPGKESWLKWARFVQDNKDKISGRAKTGDKGMTVEEVKEIISKYKEFVGVKDMPKGEEKKKDFNPEKRKSWNSLQPWEKDLWKEYLKRHPGDQGVSEDTDLRITDGMKMIMALHASPGYVKGGAREAIIQMVNDPIFLGGTLIGITLYVAAWIAPEPIFSKATAATITTVLLTLFTVSEIKNFAVAWMNLSDESSKAKSIDEIETAAEHFGKQMGGILGRVLVTIATLVGGKLLPTPKPISGGGGLTPATVTGPNGATAVPVGAIKVLPNGTIVVIGGLPGPTVAAATQGGGTGGGGGKDITKPTDTTKPGEPTKTENKASSPQEEVKQPNQEKAAETQPAQLDKAKISPGMEIDPTRSAVFRGGESFELRPTDYKTDPITRLVKTTHGASLDVNPSNIAKFGGANQIKSIPKDLKIVQRGGRLEHFEVVPREPMSAEEFQELLNQIEIYK